MPESSDAKKVLQAHHCWFNVDRAGDPATTAFKRRARLRQSLWREEHGWPVGERQSGNDDTADPVKIGSRLWDPRDPRNANFLTPTIAKQVEKRLRKKDKDEMVDEARLFADLLSSQPMSFNLFGELAADTELATKVVGDWIPRIRTTVEEVIFEYSPGRRDPAYLNNRTAFDVFARGTSANGPVFIGIEAKYHEHPKREDAPDSVKRMPRYKQVANAAGVFVDDWEDRIVGTHLQQIWLDHLLALATLQHDDDWAKGVFVLIAPAANPSWEPLAAQYREVLVHPETFQYRSLESVVDTIAKYAGPWIEDFRDRYLNLETATASLGTGLGNAGRPS